MTGQHIVGRDARIREEAIRSLQSCTVERARKTQAWIFREPSNECLESQVQPLVIEVRIRDFRNKRRNVDGVCHPFFDHTFTSRAISNADRPDKPIILRLYLSAVGVLKAQAMASISGSLPINLQAGRCQRHPSPLERSTVKSHLTGQARSGSSP